jgi:hypothetical protein
MSPRLVVLIALAMVVALLAAQPRLDGDGEPEERIAVISAPTEAPAPPKATVPQPDVGRGGLPFPEPRKILLKLHGYLPLPEPTATLVSSVATAPSPAPASEAASVLVSAPSPASKPPSEPPPPSKPESPPDPSPPAAHAVVPTPDDDYDGNDDDDYDGDDGGSDSGSDSGGHDD